MYPDPITGLPIDGISCVRYTHEAMADRIIADPSIHQNHLAAIFGFTPGWVSKMVNSDAFQAYLHSRKEELTDPELKARVEARMRSVEAQLRVIADLSLERITETLAAGTPLSDDFVLQTAKLSTAALGYGARPAGAASTNVAVIIQVPSKAQNSQEWVSAHEAEPSAPALASG
jgi:hypothetical protein